MSSDSHATITYTSMSSYEVIVNGYFGMPMEPLDSYVQLIMEAPPSPDYILGPKAPPSPDYIPGPKAPPSPDYILGPKAPPSPDYIPGPKAPPLPDYIPGPEYPEYLPPADDVLPVEEQPLPAAVSPTAESPGYITDSEPEMEPEEEDGDDEKYVGDSIEYPTSKGDDDASDDGDDLSEDDVDEEESLDSEGEEEEHLAPTVPAPALHRNLFNHIYLCHSVRSQSESTPEADMPLQKRPCFTTFTGGYEVGESSVAAAASQDKYVAEILKKCGLTEGKSASTPIDTKKPLLKDPNVKRIFRYLKDNPHLGLWYPKDSPFDLVSYSDSNYVVVATSPIEAEYVAIASCYAQVL
nr:hypothetical protein [Tanacetum cinerariifolium]